jgi:hypothetical protein
MYIENQITNYSNIKKISFSSIYLAYLHYFNLKTTKISPATHGSSEKKYIYKKHKNRALATSMED